MASSKKDRDGLFRRGEIYYCWIRGERVSTRCRSRKAAIAVRDKLERAAVDPVYRASYGATVGELCKVTLEEIKRRGRKPATVDYYTSKLGQLVRVLGADTPPAKFDTDMVDRYIDQRREEGAGQHNISKELGTWRHMLRVGKRRGMFAGDIESLFPIGFASGYEPRRRSLEWEEIPKLLGAFKASPRLQGWVALAIATGGREAEVGRVERIDISAGLDIVQMRGEKTELSDDAVAIPHAFRWLIELALAVGAETGPLVGDWANSCRDLEAACKRAKIPKVSANDLRRSHSTLLRAAGVPLDIVARQLRHADTRMVEKVYGRLTAQQVTKLLPGKPADQIQLTSSDCEGTGDYVPAEIIGVDDGNRTRDNWSHKPEAHPDRVAYAEEFWVAARAGAVQEDSEPTKNSTEVHGLPKAQVTTELDAGILGFRGDARRWIPPDAGGFGRNRDSSRTSTTHGGAS